MSGTAWHVPYLAGLYFSCSMPVFLTACNLCIQKAFHDIYFIFCVWVCVFGWRELGEQLPSLFFPPPLCSSCLWTAGGSVKRVMWWWWLFVLLDWWGYCSLVWMKMGRESGLGHCIAQQRSESQGGLWGFTFADFSPYLIPQLCLDKPLSIAVITKELLFADTSSGNSLGK